MMVGTGLSLSSIAALGVRKPLIDFLRGTLPPGASFARSTTAIRTNASGLIEAVAINAARFSNDPLTGVPLGLLIEPAGSNLLTYSQAPATGWTAAGSTLANNAATAPDGTMTAASLIDTAVSGGHLASAASITPTAGATYSYSIWLKRGANRYAAAHVNGGGLAAPIYVSTDFDSGGALLTGNGSPLSTSVTAYPGGWYRLSIAFQATSTAGLVCSVYGAVSATYAGRVYTGAGGIAAYLWGAQLEPGALATSYIATSASSVARAADGLTLPGTALGLADGSSVLRYGFDNGTTQDVATTISSGAWTVPTTLNRAIIKMIAAL